MQVLLDQPSALFAAILVPAARRQHAGLLNNCLHPFPSSPPSSQVGDLATGVVTSIHKYGAFVDICGATGLLHISQISGARVEAVEDVLSVGEQVQVLVLHLDSDTGRVGFSTRVLEEHPGDMLTKRQAVFENAAAMAAQWRAQEKVKWAEVAEDGYLQGRDASAVLAALKVRAWILLRLEKAQYSAGGGMTSWTNTVMQH
jgi:predicted RNA-binding protein with RPS1 domain